MCGICFACLASCKFHKTSPCQHLNHCGQTSSTTNRSIANVDVAENVYNIRCCSEKRQKDQTEDFFSDSLLLHRGPDVTTRHNFPISGNLQGHMQGCVLHLRGNVTPQPVTDHLGNSFLWNGEVFDGIKVKENENDTQVLFNALVTCLSDDDILRTLQQVHGPWAFIFWQASTKKLWFGRDIFGRRSLLWHLPSSVNDYIVLSSVALGDLAYHEIPSVGIFSLDFSKLHVESLENIRLLPELTLYPWANSRWPGTCQTVLETKQSDLYSFLYPGHSSCLSITIDPRKLLDCSIPPMNKSLPPQDLYEKVNDFQLKESGTLEELLARISEQKKDLCVLAEELIRVLQMAVEKRVHNLPRDLEAQREKKSQICLSNEREKDASEHFQSDISKCEQPVNHSFGKLNLCDEPLKANQISTANVAVLFSGGLDSSLLAALADRCVPEEEPIDLLNVAFEQQVPVKLGQKLKPKLKKKLKHKKMQLKECVASIETDSLWESNNFVESQSPPETSNKSNFTNAKTCGYVSQQKCPELELGSTEAMNSVVENNQLERNVQLDSHLNCLQSPTLHTAFDSIDKTSVRHSVDKETDTCQAAFDPFNVPDRQTGLIALSELNPKRKWNFVEINVSLAELQAFRQSHIYKLIYPLQTVLDDSIGCAMWFAARGYGVLHNDDGQAFLSKAKVLLCGMAADEQFAGYSRHRATFNNSGWDGLVSELQLEMWRISARNLGRDDRIITDHGKESRFPFLDETFTEFVSKIPAHMRADLQLPRGVGEKLLLRLCALKLGLLKTASQPKRAIQFGSKIAKLDNRKEKGSDVCDRLL